MQFFYIFVGISSITVEMEREYLILTFVLIHILGIRHTNQRINAS